MVPSAVVATAAMTPTLVAWNKIIRGSERRVLLSLLARGVRLDRAQVRPRSSRLEWLGAERSRAASRFEDRKVDVAIAIPFDLQRFPRIPNALAADIFSGPVVDLPPRLFDDAEDQDDSAALMQLTTHQAVAGESELLPFARSQQPALAEMPDIAGPPPVRSKINVLTLRSQLIQREVEVKILLVRDEFEFPRK